MKAHSIYPPVTDPATVHRLWQTKGAERATKIIVGRDVDTALDIFAWRKLGDKGMAQCTKR